MIGLSLTTSRGDDGPFRWDTLPDLPVGVVAPAASVSGDLLIVTGGVIITGSGSDVVQVMDLTGPQWVHVYRLAHPRYGHRQVTLDDGRVLVAGGLVLGERGWVEHVLDCELIDESRPESPVTPAGTLPKGMGTITLTRLDDGRVMAVGGHHATVYDPAQNTWSDPIRLTQSRESHAAVHLGGGRVLVIAGNGMQTCEVVDAGVSESRYIRSPSLPFNLDDHAACRLPDGRVWVIGGQQLTGVTVDNTWLITLDDAGAPTAVDDGPALDLPAGMADHVLAHTRWGVVVAGGEAEDSKRHDVELAAAVLLDVRTLAVTRLPDLPVAHDDAAAVEWRDTIIVLGGQTEGSVLGVTMPTPVSAVHMLVREAKSDP